MSSIKVWSSDGNWSGSVNGCDKVHLMKEAILTECRIAEERCHRKWDYNIDRYEAEIRFKDGRRGYKTIHESGLQIDNKLIDVANLTANDWNVDLSKLDFANANFFKMRFTTLLIMAENEESMSALYNKLMLCAKVPEDVADDYCLLFMFSNE